MAINYEHLMSLKREGDRFRYGDRETMLYAVGIGMGRDPYDENELPFVFEKGELKTVPSLATVLTRVPLLKDCGYDYTKVVHGEQRLTLHRPLPPEGELEKRLEHEGLKAHVLAVETVDKMTDRQIAAKVRERFPA